MLKAEIRTARALKAKRYRSGSFTHIMDVGRAIERREREGAPAPKRRKGGKR